MNFQTKPQKTYLFPLDHFGLVFSTVVDALVRKDGDKRRRKTALKTLTSAAKGSGQLPKEEKVIAIGLLTDTAGQLNLSFICEKKEEKEEKEEEKKSE